MLTAERVTAICLEVVAGMGHPFHINDGDCDIFAERVAACIIAETIGDDPADWPRIMWGNDAKDFFTPAHDPEQHCFVFYNGFFYDAEEPLGVGMPDQLPFYMRQLLHRDDLRTTIRQAVASKYGG